MAVAEATSTPHREGLGRRGRFRFSLANKTAILVMSLVAATTAALAGTLYTIAQQTFIDREEAYLASSLPKDAAILGTRLADLRNDALFASKLAEVRQYAGDDLPGGGVSTDGELRERLADLFTSIMQARPHYSQIRLIGYDGGGREIIRVSRSDTGVRAVPTGGLALKADRPYFTAAASLPEGRVYVSEIEFAEDISAAAAPSTTPATGAVIRASTPIYRGDGSLFGVIVINVDVAEWVRDVSRLTSTDRAVLLLNGPVDYVYFLQNNQLFQLDDQTAAGLRAQYPSLAGIFDGTARSVSAITADNVIQAERIDSNPDDPGRFLTVAAVTPMSVVLSGSDSMRNWTALVTVLMMVLAGAVTFLVARRVGRPLREMRAVAADIAQGRLDVRVKENRDTDELADLARAINDMTRRMSDSLVSRDRLASEVAERRSAQENLRAASESLAEKAAQLEQKATELESTNHELEAFAYSVSHDLRAPLRSIDGFSLALAEDYADQLDDSGRVMIRRVRDATAKMGRLIDDLLKLSRVARSTIDIVDVDVSKLAEDVVIRLRETEPDRQVTVTIAPGVRAACDPRLMSIVLANLIENAWKYSSKREGAEIVFGPATEGARRGFYVKDNGAGFDMAYADKLFKPFQRLHGSADFAGTGIGLATVARIVRRHGGTITADAREGAGATFTVIL